MHSIVMVIMVAQQPPPDPAVSLGLLAQITTPFELFNTLLGIVLPLLVALISNKGASPNVKAALLLALSIAGSILTTATTSLDGVSWDALPTAFGHIMVAAIIAHFGFWRKGLGALLSQYTAQFGIGASPQGTGSKAQPAPGIRHRDEGDQPYS